MEVNEECVSSFLNDLENFVDFSRVPNQDLANQSDQDVIQTLYNFANNTIYATIKTKCGFPSETELDIFPSLKYFVSGILTLLTAVIGTLGNILSIVTLLHRSMKNVFNHLLAVLCLVDLMVILTNIVFALKILSGKPYPSFLSSIGPWSDIVCHIAVSASVFMTMSITLERYWAVCQPHDYNTRVMLRGHFCILSQYVFPVLSIAILLNVPKLLHLAKVRWIQGLFGSNTTGYIQFGIFSQIVHPLLTTCVIPIISLICLNYSIFMGSIRIVSNHDVHLSRIMVTIVTIFILVTIPRIVLTLFEVSTIQDIVECHQRRCGYRISGSRWFADSVIRYLVLLNSSINFVIYCFVGSNFRTTLRNHIFKVASPDNPDNNSVKNDNEEAEMTFNNNDNTNILELREEENCELVDTVLVENN